MRAPRLRSIFLAGSLTLAAPGLVLSTFTAEQAWHAWAEANVAAAGAGAAGAVMRVATLLMVERGKLLDAAVADNPKLGAMVRAASDSDSALEQAQQATRAAGLSGAAVEQARTDLALARDRAARAITNHSALRAPTEQFNRLIEDLEDEASRIERTTTLANPSVGIAVGLARSVNELRGIAGRRGVLLSGWFSGQPLRPYQKDELLLLTGRLAGAWDRLQRGIRAASMPPNLAESVRQTDASFFGHREPWLRDLVTAAVTDAERPLSHAQFRAWHVTVLDALLPLRDALVSEAAARGEKATASARRGLRDALLFALLSLGLVVGAMLGLLRGLVAPVHQMTRLMVALAAGELTAPSPNRSQLREIRSMAEAASIFRHAMASLKEREAELQQTNLHFTAALENMSQGLAMFDGQERLKVFNGRFCELLGLPSERVRSGMAFRDVMAVSVEAGNYPGMTVEQAYADRVAVISRLTGVSVYDELQGERSLAVHYQLMSGGGWVVTLDDVTERRQKEAQIAHMARHDALTGLPNRVLLRERMEQVLAALRRGGRAAVLYLDLDGFKGVNDTHGHPAGDELLRQVAQRFCATIRETDLVARLGGDEFAIIQVDLDQASGASALAERLIAALHAPFCLSGGHEVSIGTSIGVVVAEGQDVTADGLLRAADVALYRAKADGRGTWRFFEPEMDAALKARRDLERALRLALAEGQYELHYQPIVSARTQGLTGFEALVRWRHPERGMVSPGEFIPLAEETGLIKPLGAWVLQRACSDAARWPSHLRVAVNLSPVQFTGGNLLEGVVEALSASGLDPDRLELEITESALVQDSAAALDLLTRLRRVGVRVAMDDFGTGYSSLSYLHRFPFDKLKIDRSFVRDLGKDGSSLEIVRAIVALGKALGLSILAEGVETVDQLAILQAEGCSELQGFLFSKPRPAQDLPSVIAVSAARLLDGSSAGANATGVRLDAA
ncbi:putative bifunctional diguanylate cyclase/phosphodiesterase [Methylobacterium sp. P31]